MLAINLLQLHEFHVEGVEHPGAIEVGRVVERLENRLLTAGNHRRQLIEVADKGHLDTTKGLISRRAI